MSNITKDDVVYVAELAKIAITDDEATHFTKELDTILGYVQQLESVDTAGLEPTYQVTGLTSVSRPDTLIDYGVTHDDLLKNAPASQDGSIKVPRVL